VLNGTLDDFALADVFRLLSAAAKTGRLDVSRAAGTGRVFFAKGEVYYAESSLAREPLGHKLVRAGALTEGQLRRALDEHAATGRRLGEILLSTATVSPAELEEAVRGQTEDAVFDLLRWERGEFMWLADEEIDVEVPISVSVENLIMEASRRLDELDVISRKIPSPDVRVAMAAKPPEGAVEINITPEEWRMLVLVNGSRTVGDIAQTVGLDEFSAMRTLYGLVSAGLIEVVSNSAGGGDVDRHAVSWRPETAREEPTTSEPAPATEAVALEQPAAPEGEPEGAESTPPADLAPEAFAAAPEAEPAASELPEREPDAEAEPVAKPDRLEPEPVSPPPEALDEQPVVLDEQVAGYTPAAPPPPAWFQDPEVAAPAPEAPAAEASAAEEETREPAPQAPSEDLPRLDRTAVVRELAGLFSEGEQSGGSRSPAGADEPDERKRVEDDDQVTKGLISRLIDGVKGL
jgi:hypothetical protein